jgi:hypothetical protein
MCVCCIISNFWSVALVFVVQYLPHVISLYRYPCSLSRVPCPLFLVPCSLPGDCTARRDHAGCPWRREGDHHQRRGAQEEAAGRHPGRHHHPRGRWQIGTYSTPRTRTSPHLTLRLPRLVAACCFVWLYEFEFASLAHRFFVCLLESFACLSVCLPDCVSVCRSFLNIPPYLTLPSLPTLPYPTLPYPTLRTG